MALARFHPVVRRWFTETLGEPTPPQRDGWPLIQQGCHTLISAPTGTGKTLAAFLSALDDLLRRVQVDGLEGLPGAALPDETLVLYVSPLRALSNDVQKNLQAPLAELRERDPSLPDIRVLVRTGDTPQRERAAMRRKPPHILVTTPESLYILLTSAGGRGMLRTVRTVIVDEIHALARDKRGSHLALSLERLEALAGPVQRIGLSATQRPLPEIASFLVGPQRRCEIVDVGHRRELDLRVEVCESPLTAVCSHEQWSEIYARIAALIREHTTTLVFVNTRRLAERVTARLREALGEALVACHHSSLSKERRLDAEQRLKHGELRALVATASLELGIDIGEVDLVIQVGSTRSIATLLQRVGRAGHAVRGVPKGRIFPLTLDELVEAAALMRAVLRGALDHIWQPLAPLDILAQQIVAACATDAWSEEDLYALARRCWPYRALAREDFDAAVALHTDGRRGLLHRDGVNGRLRGRRRAPLAAILCGGAIPDVADYRVTLQPEGVFVGTINEDFAIESSVGDIFQLGASSWRILKVERGEMLVADAAGQPPTVPFWFGEAPGRTAELSAEIATLREECEGAAWLEREALLSAAAAIQLAEYLEQGRAALGAMPTQKRVVLERFFDESGGMQLVLHAPFGSRINRAWGLALRKRFCRGFGFELQAAANEEAIVLSLGLQHSFPLDEVFNYLHPNTARKTLVQAVIDQPMFESRWRWNVSRSLVLERVQGGKRVPPPILRMRADDLLAAAFPSAVACPENLPSGDLEIPWDHPLVRQTIEDCLTDAMDVEGFLGLVRGLRDGAIERVAVDTTEPSPFAQGILNAAPYAFLDDAPLEERRTQAVISRRALAPKSADEIGALDPQAVQRVREEAWPQPESLEETHEALLWMGYVRADEAHTWRAWLAELAAAGRAACEDGRWFAAEASRDPKDVWRGRLEALGPVFDDDPTLRELEREGFALRIRLDGRRAWCERRLLARIHRYTLERLRREIAPVSPSDFLRFLARWQHVEEDHQLEGPRGVAEVVRQLAGFEVSAAAWEASILPARVRGYRREWLDELTLSGEVAWGRLWGAGASPIRTTPIALLPRDELAEWLGLAQPSDGGAPSGPAADLLAALRGRGAMFPQELQQAAQLIPAHFEMALAELIARGLLTCDSFGALRQLLVAPSRRKRAIRTVGRWSAFRAEPQPRPSAEFVATRLLRRTGVVFRRVIQRERIPAPWGELARALRQMELRGQVRGGRFVTGFSGEQFALPEAVELLRKSRRDGSASPAPEVASADPLNFRGILTPEPGPVDSAARIPD